MVMLMLKGLRVYVTLLSSSSSLPLSSSSLRSIRCLRWRSTVNTSAAAAAAAVTDADVEDDEYHHGYIHVESFHGRNSRHRRRMRRGGSHSIDKDLAYSNNKLIDDLEESHVISECEQDDMISKMLRITASRCSTAYKLCDDVNSLSRMHCVRNAINLIRSVDVLHEEMILACVRSGRRDLILDTLNYIRKPFNAPPPLHTLKTSSLPYEVFFRHLCGEGKYGVEVALRLLREVHRVGNCHISLEMLSTIGQGLISNYDALHGEVDPFIELVRDNLLSNDASKVFTDMLLKSNEGDSAKMISLALRRENRGLLPLRTLKNLLLFASCMDDVRLWSDEIANSPPHYMATLGGHIVDASVRVLSASEGWPDNGMKFLLGHIHQMKEVHNASLSPQVFERLIFACKSIGPSVVNVGLNALKELESRGHCPAPSIYRILLHMSLRSTHSKANLTNQLLVSSAAQYGRFSRWRVNHILFPALRAYGDSDEAREICSEMLRAAVYGGQASWALTSRKGFRNIVRFLVQLDVYDIPSVFLEPLCRSMNTFFSEENRKQLWEQESTYVLLLDTCRTVDQAHGVLATMAHAQVYPSSDTERALIFVTERYVNRPRELSRGEHPIANTTCDSAVRIARNVVEMLQRAATTVNSDDERVHKELLNIFLTE